MVGQVFNAGAARRTTQKVIILSTPGTSTWTVPADWNSSNNSIHCIGAGQAGGESGSTNAYGGAGGDYARVDNLTLTPGASENYNVGVRSTYSGTNARADAADDTWFGGTGVGDADVVAKGGGSSNSSSGDVTYAGGAGGPPRSYGRGGGGGSAGKDGSGGNGGPGRSNSSQQSGGGGGGANGGSAGEQDVPNSPLDGKGGNNRFGVGGGNTQQNEVSQPFNGGGGGGGSTRDGRPRTGQNGSSELAWTSTVDGEIARIGGGGGGGARSSNVGGNGGLYGGGGGGDKGVGAQGVIVIVYEGTA